MTNAQPRSMGQSNIAAPSEAPYLDFRRRPDLAPLTKRGIQDPAEMLHAMQACRKTMLKAVTESRTRGPAYRKAEKIIESLDDLIEELTGDRDSLWKGCGPA